MRSTCRCSHNLRITRRRAVSCGLHRPTSQVIHRSGFSLYACERRSFLIGGAACESRRKTTVSTHPAPTRSMLKAPSAQRSFSRVQYTRVNDDVHRALISAARGNLPLRERRGRLFTTAFDKGSLAGGVGPPPPRTGASYAYRTTTCGFTFRHTRERAHGITLSGGRVNDSTVERLAERAFNERGNRQLVFGVHGGTPALHTLPKHCASARHAHTRDTIDR